MNREIDVVVVLPPGYEPGGETRYPVLYALHGANAPYDTWAKIPTLPAALAKHPMIVVSFNGDRASWYVDSPVLPESQFMTFFFDELIPCIDTAYRTYADPNHRAVTGFSMGGYGAWNYALHRPGQFDSVSGVSGAYGKALSPESSSSFRN